MENVVVYTITDITIDNISIVGTKIFASDIVTPQNFACFPQKGGIEL